MGRRDSLRALAPAIAATVGFLTVVLAAWAWIGRAPRGIRRLTAAMVGVVVAQGVLGGLTVKYLLPTPISVAHACLAQTFFCLALVLAVVTSTSWRESRVRPGGDMTAGIAAFSVVFLQLVLGAWMRHSDAGLAIPDFPTAFGRLVPDHWDARIAVHYAHRLGALAVAATIFSAAWAVYRTRADRAPRRLAAVLAGLIPVQMFLGALSVWTRKAVPVTVAHQTLGAVVLAGTVGLAMALSRRSEGAVAVLPDASVWAVRRPA